MTMKSTILLTGVVEDEETDGGFTRLTYHRDPVAQARVDAVQYGWHRLEDPMTTVVDLEGEQVTVLRHTHGLMGGSIEAAEGRVRIHGGEVFFLPKGQRRNGYLLRPGTILDIQPGWKTPTRTFTTQAEQALAALPTLETLTQDHLDALPAPDTNHADSLDVGLMVYGTIPLPTGRAAGCTWMLTEYESDTDILNGYLRVSDGCGGESEHGSVYGRELLAVDVGKVVAPPHLTFAEAFTVGECNDSAATSIITGHQPVTAAL